MRDINLVLESLNWCAGCQTPSEPRPRDVPGTKNSIARSQRMAEARAAEGVDDFLCCDAIPPQRAAFLELLQGRGIYDVDASHLTLAPFSTFVYGWVTLAY